MSQNNLSFTANMLKSLRPKSNKYYVWETANSRNVGRLGMEVHRSAEKTFYYRYFVNGKAKLIRLGRFPSLSLADARSKLNSLKALVMEGRDPLAEEAERISAEKAQAAETHEQGTFGELIENYIQQMQKEGKRTYPTVFRDLEKNALSVINPATPANKVTNRDIAVILHKMIARGAPTHSDRVRSYLLRAFTLAIKYDNDPAYLHRPTRFNLVANPVDVIPKQARDKPGDRALSEKELRDFLLATKITGFSDEMRLLIWLMVFSGGQRTFEMVNTKWRYVDFESQELYQEPQITKNKLPFTLPLSNSLVEILRELHLFTAESPFLIPKRTNLNESMPTSSVARVVSRYCKRTGAVKFVPRDLRRTCKTLMIKHRIGSEVELNRLHNHALNDVSNKHYNRYDYFDRKLEVLQRWEDFLLKLLVRP